MSKNCKWLTFNDILVIFLTAIVFGFVFKLAWFPYQLLKPFGLQLKNLVYSLWFIAAPFSMLLVRKPGAALIGELGAGLVSLLLASGGVGVIVYAFFQGMATELVYSLGKYRNFSLRLTILAAVITSIVSLILDYCYGYLKLEDWALILAIVFRIFGAILIAGWLAYKLVQTLSKLGIIKKAPNNTDEALIG